MTKCKWLLMIMVAFGSSTANAGAGQQVRSCPQGLRVDGEYLIRHREAPVQIRAFGVQRDPAIVPDRVLFRAPSSVASSIRTLTNPFGAFARMATVEMADPNLSLLTHRTATEMQNLALREDVLSVEENCLMALADTIPNDPLYSRVWPHTTIQSPQAWDITTGSRNVIVAVIDSGVELTHEDLKNNIWTNTRELNGRAGVDDDNNGYVDDIHGYNFANRIADPSPGNQADDEHGTHVAGIIGAQGNNGRGIAGVSWQVSLMPMRVFASGGSASMADVVEAIYYAVDNGARVMNLSIGVLATPTSAELQAYAFAIGRNVLPVVAAGNNGSDASRSSPASVPGVMTVGASDGSNDLPTFTNYGSLVKVLAPGTAVYSTVLNSSYDYLSGTSMAAPFVAGTAALMLAENPSLTQLQLQSLLVSSGTTIAVHQNNKPNQTVNYPLLNIANAVKAARALLPTGNSTVTPAPTPSPVPSPVAPKPQPSASAAPVQTPAAPPQDPPNSSLGSGNNSLSSSAPSAQMGGCGRISTQRSSLQSEIAVLVMLLMPMLVLLSRRLSLFVPLRRAK